MIQMDIYSIKRAKMNSEELMMIKGFIIQDQEMQKTLKIKCKEEIIMMRKMS